MRYIKLTIVAVIALTVTFILMYLSDRYPIPVAIIICMVYIAGLSVLINKIMKGNKND